MTIDRDAGEHALASDDGTPPQPDRSRERLRGLGPTWDPDDDPADVAHDAGDVSVPGIDQSVDAPSQDDDGPWRPSPEQVDRLEAAIGRPIREERPSGDDTDHG